MAAWPPPGPFDALQLELDLDSLSRRKTDEMPAAVPTCEMCGREWCEALDACYEPYPQQRLCEKCRTKLTRGNR